MLIEDEDIVRLDDKFVFFREGSSRAVPKERLGVLPDSLCKIEIGEGISA